MHMLLQKRSVEYSGARYEKSALRFCQRAWPATRAVRIRACILLIGVFARQFHRFVASLKTLMFGALHLAFTAVRAFR